GMAARKDRPVVWDEDDAHQEGALALLEMISSPRNHKDFAERAAMEVMAATRDEAQRFLNLFPINRNVIREVERALYLYSGDLDAASRYLETAPPVRAPRALAQLPAHRPPAPRPPRPPAPGPRPPRPARPARDFTAQAPGEIRTRRVTAPAPDTSREGLTSPGLDIRNPPLR